VGHDDRSIGVFDSGIGGLTVVAALRRRLPAESIIYFGDTARVPYGIKSARVVTQFSLQICHFLLKLDPKMIVVACNTASAAALPELEQLLDIPVVGVVRPGAREAARISMGRPIAVIATEATVNSHAYRRAIQHERPGVAVHERACPMLVGAVEEGRGSDDRVVQILADEYIAPFRRLAPAVLVLGCTHYPLLKPAISHAIGDSVALVDSAEATADAVAKELASRGALTAESSAGNLRCYVSDNPQRFREIGQRFLGRPVVDITTVTLEELMGIETHAG
jgi:glutamate racemase